MFTKSGPVIRNRSQPAAERKAAWRSWLPSYALTAAISLGGFLAWSALNYRLGFPLDDAWIHQTYARNLARFGEWSFIPGQPSAGSTAPLWSLLLAGGHFLRLGPYVWTFLLGWLALVGIGLAGERAFRIWLPHRAGWAPWIGGLLLFEWHLVWAAGSGMETLLYSLVVLVCLVKLSGERVSWFGIGLLSGLSAWLRPDGITLLGPALLILVANSGEPARKKLAAAVQLAVGVSLVFGPYLIFNRLLAGAWWPNTFFAKQAEYAVTRQVPFLARIAQQALPPLVGVGAVLVPGFVLALWQAARERKWGMLAAGLWVIGYVCLYAWRLPVTYQHGRYVLPVIPVFLALSAVGFAGWIQLQSGQLLRRLVSRTWALTCALVLVAFWLQGGAAYVRDVAIIESEMVATARWVAQNTPPEARIAAHDIGALGYFADRQILDLAGLVSPEVIPFIRDEIQLAGFLEEQRADYLITFPGWYPALVRQAEMIFTTNGLFSPDAGGENMAVYRWR